MIGQVPAYISIVFLITSFLTFGIFAYAINRVGFRFLWSKLLLLLVPFWMLFQAALAMGGFFLRTDTVPPRLAAFAVFPAILLMIACFLTGRVFIEKLPLKVLTLVHVVRIPVEIVLASLFAYGAIPEVMTFHGWNYDIASGVLAVLVLLFAFPGNAANKNILIAFNIAGLLLLANIVTIAILALESPIQKLAFDQPNRGVLYFPYIWLPAMIVPVVLFAHLAALWKLYKNKLA